MNIVELLQEKREEILRIAAEHGARNIRVFGSAVRGEAGPDSDTWKISLEEKSMW